jgi:hypothetical protein
MAPTALKKPAISLGGKKLAMVKATLPTAGG